jgi:hypothetical protein
MFPDHDYTDEDRLLVATALLDYAGNPDHLTPGSVEFRAYSLIADLATQRGIEPAELFKLSLADADETSTHTFSSGRATNYRRN